MTVLTFSQNAVGDQFHYSPRRQEALALLSRFQNVRKFTERLCAPLLIEDYGVQSMLDVSPPKWHLAHTTWFFESFLLSPFLKGYREFHPQFSFLFNSYYEAVGPRLERSQRGLISRPSVQEVLQYRAIIDQRIGDLLDKCSDQDWEAIRSRMELGINHEQQHQELLLTDIKHIFWSNPLRPAYRNLIKPRSVLVPDSPHQWVGIKGGVHKIGKAPSSAGFAFDNEGPRHEVYLRTFRIGNRLVTSGEYLEFIEAGGYRNPMYWLSDGWDCVQRNGWSAPFYWEKAGSDWWMYTLSGMRPVHPDEPVVHVSYYEADAFARWRRVRLPTEAEWEVVSETAQSDGNFVESAYFHPHSLRDVQGGNGVFQMFGDVWEWTSSAYAAYPGYQPLPDALGEYNGKFMCNQFVLRGGSCVTSVSHFRNTYRNFFRPDARWQFSGIRLAMDEA